MLTIEQERRWRWPAASAALLAAVLQLFASRTQGGAFAGSQGQRGLLTSLSENNHDALRGVVLESAATVPAALALAYLLWAAGHRVRLSPWIWAMVVLAPIAATAGLLLVQSSLTDVAREFTDSGARTEGRAKHLLERGTSDRFWLTLLGYGPLAVTCCYASVRAMRAGLFNGVLGYVGIALGVLLVVPVIPGTSITMALLWFPALAVLFLDRWPKGRGRSWSTGQPERWETSF